MAQPESPWYVDFFARDYREAYDHILTSQRTDREVAFAAHALGLVPGERVLDLCCGHGRHAIPLARRGLRVAGLDLNAESLEEARLSRPGPKAWTWNWSRATCAASPTTTISMPSSACSPPSAISSPRRTCSSSKRSPRR